MKKQPEKAGVKVEPTLLVAPEVRTEHTTKDSLFGSDGHILMTI